MQANQITPAPIAVKALGLTAHTDRVLAEPGELAPTEAAATEAESPQAAPTQAGQATTDRTPSSFLEQASDEELLLSTRRLVGHSNRVLATLLVHLAEVEARGVHRIRACSSLYTYCIYELRLSEDEAARRVNAARLVKRFPALFAALERGELHLTGLLLLGPHLTLDNHLDVLSRAKHRTKKEIQKLIRELSPLPDVPARIEPLGPGLTTVAGASTSWDTWMQSLCPVRDLCEGDRPADWLSGAPNGAAESITGDDAPALAPVAPSPSSMRGNAGSTQPDRITGPQRYRVQFSAGDEYVELVERAQALLSHMLPGGALEELHLRAMRALVAELEKRRYAVTTPRPDGTRGNNHPALEAKEPSDTDERASLKRLHVGTAHVRHEGATHAHSEHQAPQNGDMNPQERGCAESAMAPRQRGCAKSAMEPCQRGCAELAGGACSTRPQHQKRGRSVPAHVRRAVFERDAGRCTYVDESGQRCPETRRLELHHGEPHARGGAHVTANLSLRCSSHNALAAEQDFGRAFIQCRRDASRHESAASQTFHPLWRGG